MTSVRWRVQRASLAREEALDSAEMKRLVPAILIGLALASVASAQEDLGTSQPVEGADQLSAPSPTRAMLVVVPTVGRGIDPVVAPHVTARLREVALALGYESVDEAETNGLVARYRLRDVTSPADLWRVTFLAHARRGVVAHVWAERGRYVFEIVVASLDGTGPFRARGDASATELLDRVEAELRRVLAPATEWNQAEAERLAQNTAPAHPAANAGAFPPPVQRLSRRERGPTRTDRPFGITLQTEGAVGTSASGFYNHMVGLRLNYYFSRNFALGVYLGYVNLRGNDGRVSNLLPYVQLEHRIHILGVDGLSVPVRGAAGFLPYNGFFVRVSGGLNLPIGDHFELGADLLTPTIWFTPEGREVSFDVALEVIYRFGARASSPSSASNQ